MKRKITALLLAVMLLPHQALASVLGSTRVSHIFNEISDGTVLYENKYMSDQNGVGLQSEYYAEYTPNSDTVPVVVTGESIYGKRTAKEAADYMIKNGMRPMLGINASYFSLQTGVPMGHVISDGRVMSKDITTLRSIGFTKNGEAFIAPLTIDVTLHTAGGEAGIANVNKYNVATQPGVSLFNSDFGKETKNEIESLSVTLDVNEGELVIGGEIKATVSGKFVYQGGLAISENQIIVSINTDGASEYHYNILNALEVGDEVTITCTAEDDERWESAVYALGSEGETLIENGVVTQFPTKTAAPRTAVGITADGKVIFYVIDGRQSGHSYGVQLGTLAKRMAELGCVEAINLDGGGSTSISGVYPGADEMAVINSPSDKTLRSVTNFIFLKNNNEPTGELKSIYVTPQQQRYLTGSKAELSAVGIDSTYYKTELPEVEYSVNGESTVEGNILTLNGSGTVEVTAKSGGVETVSPHYVYDTPDAIVLLANAKAAEKLTLETGSEIKLAAEAYVAYAKLIADESCFTYSIEGNIGQIDENNVFHAVADRTSEGAIIVTAGTKSVSVPVKVINDDYIFEDITEHWAKEMIREMARRGVVNGYETETGLEFLPDNNITRAEFCVMLAGYLALDIESYENAEKIFDDEIPSWAKNSVAALYELGFVSGKETESGLNFAAGDKITRAESAAIIGRAMSFLTEEAELAFDDAEQIPEWARAFTARLVAAGVVSGYDDNTVRPSQNVTRAEAVTMLYKVSAIKSI